MEKQIQPDSRQETSASERWVKGMISEVFASLREKYPSDEFRAQLEEYRRVMSEQIAAVVRSALRKMELNNAFQAVHFLKALDVITDEQLYRTMKCIWDAKISLMEKKSLFHYLKQLLWDYHEREMRELVECFESCLELTISRVRNVDALQVVSEDELLYHSLEVVLWTGEKNIWDTIGGLTALEILGGENPHAQDYLANSLLIESGEQNPAELMDDPGRKTHQPLLQEEPSEPAVDALDTLEAPEVPTPIPPARPDLEEERLKWHNTRTTRQRSRVSHQPPSTARHYEMG